MVYYTEVTDYERMEQVRSSPKEGVFVHGLYLDGAAWSKAETSVIESEPRVGGLKQWHKGRDGGVLCGWGV